MGRERNVELSWLPFVFVCIFCKCSCASSDIYEEGAKQKSFSRCQTSGNIRMEENWPMFYQKCLWIGYFQSKLTLNRLILVKISLNRLFWVKTITESVVFRKTSHLIGYFRWKPVIFSENCFRICNF